MDAFYYGVCYGIIIEIFVESMTTPLGFFKYTQ